MQKYTFAEWLRGEVAAARYSLITLHEKKDKLLYVDGPQLENTYMEKVGAFEETVIKAEIECELIRKKQQMIQAALNRREPIDEAAIDTEIDRLRQEMLEEAAGAAPRAYADLNEEQLEALQRLYREIVKNFHPQMHPELTETQKELFRKAQDAYRMRDLEAIKLIYDMLMSAWEDELSTALLLQALAKIAGLEEEKPQTEEKQETGHSADYKLAKEIYDCFQLSAEEAISREEWSRYQQMITTLLEEIEKLRKQFPYNAAEMLADPDQIEAYKKALEHRLHAAVEECNRRRQEIDSMMGKVAAHG